MSGKANEEKKSAAKDGGAELMDMFDADRRPTGIRVPRSEPNPEGTYRLVVHVCIFNSVGKMLIQRRADDIFRWPGLWDISVGGGAGAGDSSRAAAVRETAEELGLAIELDGARPALCAAFADVYDDFYIVRKDVEISDLKLQEDEVAEARWADLEEVEKLIDSGAFIPYQKDFMRYLFFLKDGAATWDLAKKIENGDDLTL